MVIFIVFQEFLYEGDMCYFVYCYLYLYIDFELYLRILMDNWKIVQYVQREVIKFYWKIFNVICVCVLFMCLYLSFYYYFIMVSFFFGFYKKLYKQLFFLR